MKTLMTWLAMAMLAVGAKTKALDAESLAAIRHCREEIIRLQLPDGAWRFSAEQADHVRIVPYFGNVAAKALALAQTLEPQAGDSARVEKWLDWYASHTRKDGTILDHQGTMTAYAPSDKRDSIDTYAPTYLTALWWYSKLPLDAQSRAKLLPRATQALAATESTIDPADGLAWSSVPHKVKYPMDNLEVCLGLVDGERLFAALGAKDQAAKALRLREQCQKSLAQFWLADQHYFAWAKGQSKLSTSFEKPYPEGVVNVFAAACVEPPPPGLYERLQSKFGASERLAPDMWLAAAHRYALPTEIKLYRQICLAGAQQKELNLERAARLLIILAGVLPEGVPVDCQK